MALHAETAPGLVRQKHGRKGQDVDVAVWLLALIPGVVDGQGECFPLDIGPALFVLPSTSADPGRLQPELTTGLFDHKVHVSVAIDFPGFDGIADFCGNGAEQLVHGFRYREPLGQ